MVLKSSKSLQQDGFIDIWAVRTNQDYLRLAHGQFFRMALYKGSVA